MEESLKGKVDLLCTTTRALCLENGELGPILCSLIKHLSSPTGSYEDLLVWSNFYGETFIAPELTRVLSTTSLGRFSYFPKRILDLGAGYGWLGRVLEEYYHSPCIYIDKRPWTPHTQVVDVEKEPIQAYLQQGDLVVFSDLLHCLEDPQKFIHSLKDFPAVCLECDSSGDGEYSYWFRRQLQKFRATPFNTGEVLSLLPDSTPFYIYPYRIYLRATTKENSLT